jgi:hypothetical protein
MRWYVPSWNGDIRFEPIDGDHTLVTMIEPTAAEHTNLLAMERIFYAYGWLKGPLWDPKSDPRVQSRRVAAPLLEVAKRILASYTRGNAVLTAVRFENDKIRAFESGQGFWRKIGEALHLVGSPRYLPETDLTLVDDATKQRRETAEAEAEAERFEARRQAEAAERQRRDAAEKLEAEQAEIRREREEIAAKRRAEQEAVEAEARAKRYAADAERMAREAAEETVRHAKREAEAAARRAEEAARPKAATTIRKPTSCCPNCVVGPMSPAKEVLFAFLTEDEKAQWREDHSIVITGGYSGHRYLLAHRNSHYAARYTKICHDLDDDVTLHFHDTTVPPEEEVLAAKLILEHREDWLRNESTFFGWTDVRFVNPFGDVMDGTASAGMTQRFGKAMSTIGQMLPGRRGSR